MKQYRPRFHRIFTFFLLPVLLFSACSLETPVSRTGFYFDTVISVTLYDSADTALLEECFSLAGTYEHRFSRTQEGSDIWRINHAAGEAVAVHEDTIRLLKKALYYARLTEGRIDPTISSVKDLWDFSGGPAVLPDKEAISEALSHVDYRTVEIAGRTVRLKDKNASLDLGFIAKGFIADRMREYLQSQGVKSALINLGGNVAAVGGKSGRNPFTVGVQEPFAASGVSVTALPLIGESAVTSGSYERYFTWEGKVYHHILNAKTGYPVWNNLSSVTVVTESSETADALSTACFVLGLTQGMELIESLEQTEALFITSDGTLYPSSGLKQTG